jgi:uncharacterized damage-inducible protein DinB
MKETALNFCTLLLLCSVAFGQTLTQTDKEKAATYLDETRDGLVAATKGLSEAQMKFKPAPDRWSVAETLEHIVPVEDSFLQNLTDKVMQSPPGAADIDTAKIDAMVKAMVPDRSHKAQASPPVTPTGRWTPADTLDRFLKTRAQTIAFLESTPELRAHLPTVPSASHWTHTNGCCLRQRTASVTQNKSSKCKLTQTSRRVASSGHQEPNWL